MHIFTYEGSNLAQDSEVLFSNQPLLNKTRQENELIKSYYFGQGLALPKEIKTNGTTKFDNTRYRKSMDTFHLKNPLRGSGDNNQVTTPGENNLQASIVSSLKM